MLSANSDVLLHLGVSGLFSGFGWLAFGRVFGIGARFGVYEILTAYCKGKVFFLNLLLVLLFFRKYCMQLGMFLGKIAL
jgi:hypothetical protein